MYNKYIKLVLGLLLVACDSGSGSHKNNTKQELREVGVDAGLAASIPFQCGYSEYIWADNPLVYIPTFGLTFNTSADSLFNIKSANLDNLTEHTIEFWFNPVTDGTFDNDGSVVFDFRDDLGSTSGLTFYWQDMAETFYLSSPGMSPTSVFNSTDLIIGSNHVAITTNDGGFRVFLNGILIQNLSFGDYVAPSGYPFRIGTNTAGDQNYVGQLDNFAIYSHVLTNDEILQHYAVGADLLNR